MCGMISWTGILWTSIRWNKGLKAQGIDRKTLPYMAPLQPYLSYCKSIESYLWWKTLIAVAIQMEYQSVSWSSHLVASVLSVSLHDVKPLCILLINLKVPTFDASSFVTTYFPIPFFAALFFGYKFWTKSKMINYADMDFVTGSSIEVTEKVRSR